MPNALVTGASRGVAGELHATRMMVPKKRGLIVNISFWAAQKHIGNVIYGISKAAHRQDVGRHGA